MAGHIYITGAGADPQFNPPFNDPLFGAPPTLGGCMPNIRRTVSLGDWIFVISGRLSACQQFVVGGFKVEEKISAIEAYGRFPQNRLRLDDNGKVQGNILIDENGAQHPLDRHKEDSFERRIENYIVGGDSIHLETPQEMELGRQQTLNKLPKILGRPPANRVIDFLGRHRKLDNDQVQELISWLSGIKDGARE